MKKLLPVLIFLSACHSGNNGTYVAHIENQYTIADDTLVIENTIIINSTGYQNIRHGKLLPKQHKVKQWGVHSLDAPALLFDADKIIFDQTIYQRIK